MNKQQQYIITTIKRISSEGGYGEGWVNIFYWPNPRPILCWRLTTKIVKLALWFPNLCNASPGKNNQIMKRDRNSQTVSAKENPKLNHRTPSKRQASDTNPPMTVIRQGRQ